LTVAEPVYYIDIPANIEGGALQVQSSAPYLAAEGETVTLTVSPDEGWELATIQVVDYNNGSVAVPLNCTASACTFTMPAFNIRIAVVFRDLRSTASDDIKALRDLKAFTQDGVLYVSGIADGTTLRVYNITGTLVYQGAASADKAEIVLPARGVYIVTDGKTVVKVNN